jgi:prepilin-type N-terminal cleavage/methylation domain-containing protein
VTATEPRGGGGGWRAHTRDAGFTLIELTVSLVAGLIVALGIVGLSKEATRTFHEEVRTSMAEATLRTAVDRLRADLQRASYMSVANIVNPNDPDIAHVFGSTNVSQIKPAMLGILRLAGLHIFASPSSSTTNTTALSGLQVPVLSPDTIEIGGNMTSADQFEVQTVGPSPASANCTRLTFSASSPALYRVLSIGTAKAAVELNNMFQPDPNSQFIVRLLDDTGRAQYLPTCAGGATAGITGTTGWVDVDTLDTRILSEADTKSLGGVNATPGGAALVNPVQIVRWEIVTAAQEPPQYAALGSQALSPGVLDPNKYDLVRSFVNAQGVRVDATMEVVAEYAVDLEFAFSVENGTAAAPVMLTFPFDDSTNNPKWAADVSLGTVPPTQPQRIRVARARVVTRAAQPDRTVNIPIAPPNLAVGATGTQAFLYRYCLIAPCTTQDDTLRWARTRTMTTEVSILNQVGDFF